MSPTQNQRQQPVLPHKVFVIAHIMKLPTSDMLRILRGRVPRRLMHSHTSKYGTAFLCFMCSCSLFAGMGSCRGNSGIFKRLHQAKRGMQYAACTGVGALQNEACACMRCPFDFASTFGINWRETLGSARRWARGRQQNVGAEGECPMLIAWWCVPTSACGRGCALPVLLQLHEQPSSAEDRETAQS